MVVVETRPTGAGEENVSSPDEEGTLSSSTSNMSKKLGHQCGKTRKGRDAGHSQFLDPPSSLVFWPSSFTAPGTIAHPSSH
ncbi:unnamed protein product [Pleuronectes platessa]|uniref:Uncharacterized protein n=1 Tax=Pleuronectes platessa TaxID=8262 RepID=A0A9N7YJC9_PLEPL|nr:unnamed protein product [Pleuronectes platessa]